MATDMTIPKWNTNVVTLRLVYKKTIQNFDKLISLGYNVKYIWERDWCDYLAGKVESPLIHTHLRNCID